MTTKLTFGMDKSALAAEARERKKVDAAKRAIREHQNRLSHLVKGLAAVATPCPRTTVGSTPTHLTVSVPSVCGKMPWAHAPSDWACDPKSLWHYELRKHSHAALCQAMREIESSAMNAGREE